MRLLATVFSLLLAASASAQAPSSADAWKPFEFLQGTWQAKASGDRVAASGSYTFRLELGNHILARHSTNAGDCKGRADYDCDHGDLLYLYRDAPSQPLRAIYFDNEGHVIHYDVTMPSATSVVFLSETSQPGPRFRLSYELKGELMYGRFQIQMPGQTSWTNYLEWSGAKLK